MTTPVSQPVDAAARPPRSRRVRILLTAGGLVVAVILAWLVWPSPGGAAVLHTGNSHYVVTATVDNPRVGATTVEIDVTSRTGGPDHPGVVTVQAVMPLMGHAAPPVAAVPIGGRYRADGVPLMMTGPMELLLSIDFAGGVDHLMLPLTVSG
jgi:hypothetical protein